MRHTLIWLCLAMACSSLATAQDKPPGTEARLHWMLQRMLVLGPQTDVEMRKAAAEFYAQPDSVAMLVTRYFLTRHDEHLLRWQLLRIAGYGKRRDTVDFLTAEARKPLPYALPEAPLGHATSAQDEEYVNRIAAATGVVEAMPGAGDQRIRDVIATVDEGIARIVGSELFARNLLNEDLRLRLESRGIPTGHRFLSAQEERALSALNPTFRPREPRTSGTVASAVPAPAGVLSTCGVTEPWNSNTQEGFYTAVLGCDSTVVDNAWGSFHMEDGDWRDYGLEEDACNSNTPLGRTIYGIQLLRVAGTDTPQCEGSDFPLNWSHCWAANAIEYLTVKCDGGFAAATTKTFGIDQLDPRTELHVGFFYNSTAAKRASTIVHEARHAESGCTHTTKCKAGETGNPACDPQFEHGCIGGEGKGAYAWAAIWLHRYAVEAQAHLINGDMRFYAVQSANSILERNFEVTPCFVYSETTGHVVEMSCTP
jgi:hypothetical protein